MKRPIFLVTATLGMSLYNWAQTGRATKGQETLPTAGTARLYVTPMPAPDKSLVGLIKAADVVIDGTVQSVLPARQPSASTLETDARIAIGSVIKGPLVNNQIMVSQMGGVVGPLKIVPQQYDLMKAGERYVLFLKRDIRPSTPKISGAPAYYVLGAWLGLVRVIDNKVLVKPGSADLSQRDGSDVSVFETALSDSVTSLGLGR